MWKTPIHEIEMHSSYLSMENNRVFGHKFVPIHVYHHCLALAIQSKCQILFVVSMKMMSSLAPMHTMLYLQNVSGYAHVLLASKSTDYVQRWTLAIPDRVPTVAELNWFPVVYWLGHPTLVQVMASSNLIRIPLLSAKAVDRQPSHLSLIEPWKSKVMWIVQWSLWEDKPAGSRAPMVLNYSRFVVLGSGSA